MVLFMVIISSLNFCLIKFVNQICVPGPPCHAYGSSPGEGRRSARHHLRLRGGRAGRRHVAGEAPRRHRQLTAINSNRQQSTTDNKPFEHQTQKICLERVGSFVKLGVTAEI